MYFARLRKIPPLLSMGLLGVFLLITGRGADASENVQELMVVDCLLPGQVRRLGEITYLANRKAIKATGENCASKGGEYVAYDRASTASTLTVWLPLAEQGDARAQLYVGEAYEKGVAGEPNYALAAEWYMKAAEQNNPAAAVNIGNMFDQGLGFPQDKKMARHWYQRASNPGAHEFSENPNTDSVASTRNSGITLIEPELEQRDGQYLLTRRRSSEPILVVGKVETNKHIDKVLVNGHSAKLVNGDLFRALIKAEGNEVEVEAYDNTELVSRLNFSYGMQDSAGFEATSKSSASGAGTIDRSAPPAGNFYALIVGNNHYLELPELDTAVNDARSMQRVLGTYYGFETELMIDANRYDVLSALNRLSLELGTDDHLLIYYAGHGELDRINNRGYWLPIDAEEDNSANWISNIAITDLIQIIPASQLIVIADSCYSGTISRYAIEVSQSAFHSSGRDGRAQKLAGIRSRTVLTSGGVAPVIDGLGGRNSVFASEVIATLEKNSGTLTGYELFQQVSPRVTQSAANVGFKQIPEYAPLKFAGHEAGDFVFYRTH